MKISRLCLLFAVVLMSVSSCKKSEGSHQDVQWGTWTIKNQQFVSQHTTVGDKTAETECTADHKIWLTFGEFPNGTMDLKVVPYTKQNLAPNEVKIDVAHGVGLDYFSTGGTMHVEFVSYPEYTDDFLYVTFSSLLMQGWGATGPNAGDTASLNGFLQGY